MNDQQIAFAIAAAEPRHLDKPTTPPLAWRRLEDDFMSVTLADGRKVIRKIPAFPAAQAEKDSAWIATGTIQPTPPKPKKAGTKKGKIK